MRTDLFSLNDKNSCTAHRIELCRHFNSKLLWWQFWMFFNQKFAFQNKNVGAVSFIQFELFLAYKSDTSRTCQDKSARYITDLLRTHSGIRRTPAWRIRSRPTAHRTHRQPKCLDALAHSHCLRRFYHARTVAECKYPFPTFIATSHLRYVKPKMLSLSFRVIAHLWAGTAHRPTIGNNVTPDPIFNCQVTVWILLVHFRSPLYTAGCVIYIPPYHITQFGEEWAGSLNRTLLVLCI